MEKKTSSVEWLDNMDIIYFQPAGINPKYCEIGTIKNDYVYYLNEPCKVLLTEVKIIPKENVIYDKKHNLHRVFT